MSIVRYYFYFNHFNVLIVVSVTVYILLTLFYTNKPIYSTTNIKKKNQ